MRTIMSISFLLLALSAFLASAEDVSVSIDCGSSESSMDDNYIYWLKDDDLIHNGLIQTINSNRFSSEMNSLRVFTTRKKNCYNVEVNKGSQILVRASFFYGNYDKKSSPPTFDLHFDGNYWATVETSITDLVYYEVIYVAKRDVTSVCVAQTKSNQFPFMSALEVRSLGSNMYSHVDANFALLLKSRVAYGTNETIRYRDDTYDRIWQPTTTGVGLIEVESSASSISVADLEDEPPQQVLLNAITTSTTSQYISLGPKFPSSGAVLYMNMYFSEVSELDSTQKRSFRVYKDNQSISAIIEPPYGSALEFTTSNLTVSSDTTLAVMATTDSTLPPLINAMEMYYISDRLTDGTNENDVEGLASLQNQFDVLADWSDPCLPAPYSWEWINCSSGATPRVTALKLSSFGLSGSTLPDFSSMTALETIDLRNNSLEGEIPEFLGNFPNLKELNLADNDFSGPIPTSLSKNSKIKLVVTGNPNVCKSGQSCQVIDSPAADSGDGSSTTTDSYGKKKKNNLPVILGVTIPVFVIFWAIVGVCTVLHQKRKTAAVVATTGTGQNGGLNQRNGAQQQNTHMLGKMGESVIDVFKANNNDQEQATVELSDQTDQRNAPVEGNQN